jgi:hypothetical protein
MDLNSLKPTLAVDTENGGQIKSSCLQRVGDVSYGSSKTSSCPSFMTARS